MRAATDSVQCCGYPDLCDFYYGSVYTCGDLKIAISTNGAAPAFGKKIKAELAERYPETLRPYLRYLQKMREIAKEKSRQPRSASRFWRLSCRMLNFSHKLNARNFKTLLMRSITPGNGIVVSKGEVLMFVVPPSGDTPENLCLKGTLLQSFRNIDTRETGVQTSVCTRAKPWQDCRGKAAKQTLVCTPAKQTLVCTPAKQTLVCTPECVLISEILYYNYKGITNLRMNILIDL